MTNTNVKRISSKLLLLCWMLHEAFTREMSGMTAIPYNSSSTSLPWLESWSTWFARVLLGKLPSRCKRQPQQSVCTAHSMYITVLIQPFLPPFSPLTRHSGQVFLGLPNLIIIPNPHAHCAKFICPLCKPHVDCANPENYYVMKHARYRPQTSVPVSMPIQKF